MNYTFTTTAATTQPNDMAYNEAGKREKIVGDWLDYYFYPHYIQFIKDVGLEVNKTERVKDKQRQIAGIDYTISASLNGSSYTYNYDEKATLSDKFLNNNSLTTNCFQIGELNRYGNYQHGWGNSPKSLTTTYTLINYIYTTSASTITDVESIEKCAIYIIRKEKIKSLLEKNGIKFDDLWNIAQQAYQMGYIPKEYWKYHCKTDNFCFYFNKFLGNKPCEVLISLDWIKTNAIVCKVDKKGCKIEWNNIKK